MWCPEGYVQFQTVSDNVSSFHHAAISRMTSEARSERPMTQAEKMLASGIVRDKNNAKFAAEYLELHLLSTLITLWPPSICSPSGSVLRVAETFFLHADRLDWIYPSFPLDEVAELSSLFCLSRKNGFSGTSLKRRYCFLDIELGLVTVKNNSRSLFNNAAHSWDDWGDEMLSIVKPFRGWALCWKEGELPNGLDLIKSAFPDTDNKWNWESLFGKEAVSSSCDATLDAILQAYPDGKTENWQSVEKKTGYSRRSIERALRDKGRRDWKTQGGQA